MPAVKLTNKKDSITGEQQVDTLDSYLANYEDSENAAQFESNTSTNTGAEMNLYSAANNKTPEVTKEAYAPNTQGYENSGAGAEAAIGTKYTWEDKASKMAENSYQQKTLEEKQNMLTQRQELEKNAQQYQTQADMRQYTDNQTAEKVGWTGGYVLDQERQREYMKQSIQAQLYGAMELQKYGYDTSMAAARLAYDANMMQFAEEYYNQAVQTAINEAQITGTYFSAEVRDMLSQRTVADEKIKELEGKENRSPEEEETLTRAKNVSQKIKDWFGENNISEAGIKTLERYSAEQSLELQWQNELWTQYNSALQASAEDIKAYNKIYALDEEGKIFYDGKNVKILDLNNMSTEEKIKYATKNQACSDQILGYMEGTVGAAISAYKQKVYDESTKKYNTNQHDLAKIINDAVASATKDFDDKATTDSEKTTVENLTKAVKEYASTQFTIEFPGKDINTIGNNGTGNNGTGGNGTETINNNITEEEAKKNAIAEGWLDADAQKWQKIDVKTMSWDSFKQMDGQGQKGDFWDANKEGSAQNVWQKVITDLSKQDKIPNGTVVNMNVGASAIPSTSDTYIYINGSWIRTKGNNDSKAYKVGKSGQTGSFSDQIKDNVKAITGIDYDELFDYKINQ